MQCDMIHPVVLYSKPLFAKVLRTFYSSLIIIIVGTSFYIKSMLSNYKIRIDEKSSSKKRYYKKCSTSVKKMCGVKY